MKTTHQKPSTANHRPNPLRQLQELGQSPWLDNIDREMLVSGELARLIEAGEITGLTSNPTIFEKAIAGTGHYDKAIAQLVREGKSAGEIFDELSSDDIREVADLLRPVHQRTDGRDGYVSIEVSPALGHDAAASIAEARRLFELVGRPNVMVKVPGTDEGADAFEELTADGLNINVTLLFSIDSYERVARSYVAGLARAKKAGKRLDKINSVASFFVSRVDSAADAMLEELVRAGRTEAAELQGKVAVANSKLAHQRFQQIFAEAAFARLAESGARVQRVLWGSSGTKNPRYSDVLYVDSLIGPNTVNTMPPATIAAFRDHGMVAETVTRDVDEAASTIRRLGDLGISLRAITDKLQVDGLAAFTASFESLLSAVEQKREALARVA